MNDSVLASLLEAADFKISGLAVRDWPLPADVRSRGTVLLVHGLGEHMGRYEALARELNRWRFAVRAYDHFGHGLSDGPRGALFDSSALLDDLTHVFDDTRGRIGDARRLILLGHSMGGLVASLFAAQLHRRLEGLVLSSPALDAGLNAFQKVLVSILPRLAPNLRVGNGLDASYLSHDAAQVKAYRDDPLVHDRIAARLARFIDDGGPKVLAGAKSWAVPTLLMYAGQDHLVNPKGSRMFEALAPVDIVESHCFESLYHELFNEAEPGRSHVFETLRHWLDENFP